MSEDESICIDFPTLTQGEHHAEDLDCASQHSSTELYTQHHIWGFGWLLFVYLRVEKKKVFRSAEVGKAETLKEAFQKDLQKKGQEH